MLRLRGTAAAFKPKRAGISKDHRIIIKLLVTEIGEQLLSCNYMPLPSDVNIFLPLITFSNFPL